MKIFLDLDGTLISNSVRQCLLLNAKAMLHDRKLDTEAVWSAKREGQSNRQVLAELHFACHEIDDICSAWARDIETPYWLALDSVIPGVGAALRELSRDNDLALLTARQNRANLLSQLYAKDLYEYFTDIHVVSPQGVAQGKARILEDEGADLFVGDGETDFSAASQAGIRFIGVSSGQRSEAFLKRSGVTEIFPDLPDAVARGAFRRAVMRRNWSVVT
jgi:phosphoglycolate phosphatase-like HAD superfamily hydrolase